MRPQLKFSILFFVLMFATSSFPQYALALDAEGWFEKGNELSQQGQFKEAITAYQKSVEQNPKSPVAHYNLGIAYKNLQEFEKAVSAFKKTLELEPFHLDARVSLGNVYNRLSQWEDAIGQLNIVVHRNRNNAEAHGNLGWAYYNYKNGPPFKHLVIINLKKAVNLFTAQNMSQAAKATQKVLDEAIAKFGYQPSG
jgi:tetratricopeptide (TPR) repeat protein